MPFTAPPFSPRRRAPTTGPDIEADLLACALCRTGSLPDLEQHFEPALLELADRRYRGLSLQETLLTAAQANGHQSPLGATSAVVPAPSTLSLETRGP